jgi:hypothetical protein
MAAKLTRLTHKIAIQLYLVAERCTICSSRSRRPVLKLLATPSYVDCNQPNKCPFFVEWWFFLRLHETSYVSLFYILCIRFIFFFSHSDWPIPASFFFPRPRSFSSYSAPSSSSFIMPYPPPPPQVSLPIQLCSSSESDVRMWGERRGPPALSSYPVMSSSKGISLMTHRRQIDRQTDRHTDGACGRTGRLLVCTSLLQQCHY